MGETNISYKVEMYRGKNGGASFMKKTKKKIPFQDFYLWKRNY